MERSNLLDAELKTGFKDAQWTLWELKHNKKEPVRNKALRIKSAVWNIRMQKTTSQKNKRKKNPKKN